jgi:hypothetical protein
MTTVPVFTDITTAQFVMEHIVALGALAVPMKIVALKLLMITMEVTILMPLVMY